MIKQLDVIVDHDEPEFVFAGDCICWVQSCKSTKLLALKLEEDKLHQIDLDFLLKDQDTDSKEKEVEGKIKLDAIDPITLALQGCTEFNEYFSLERFSNHLQVYIADRLVMLNLNGDEIQAVQELENLQAYTNAENLIETCFKPRYETK